jgi:hypothetical protein
MKPALRLPVIFLGLAAFVAISSPGVVADAVSVVNRD